MSKVTGELRETHGGRGEWQLSSQNWPGTLRGPDGMVYGTDDGGLWFFARRIDAVAFAARKGIRLEER